MTDYEAAYESLQVAYDRLRVLIASYAALRASHDRLLAAAKFAKAESDAEPNEPMSWAAHTNLQAAIAAAEELAQ
jgi:hypothetical protein